MVFEDLAFAASGIWLVLLRIVAFAASGIWLVLIGIWHLASSIWLVLLGFGFGIGHLARAAQDLAFAASGIWLVRFGLASGIGSAPFGFRGIWLVLLSVWHLRYRASGPCFCGIEHLARVYGWYCVVERLCPLHRGVLKCIVFGASVHNRTVQYFADHIGILITYRDWRIMAAR